VSKRPSVAGVIVRAKRGAQALRAAGKSSGVKLEPLFANLPKRPACELGAAASAHDWMLGELSAAGEASPWAAVHELVLQLGGDEAVELAEPDLVQGFPAFAGEAVAFGARGGSGVFDPQDSDLPRGPGFAWFLREEFSQLGRARADGAAPARILHIDTGYDPEHRSVPRGLLAEYARDFEGGGERPGAVDPGVSGALKNPGHGTGTLGILAGGRVTASPPGEPRFDGDIGAAPGAQVIPVRIATSVVMFRTSALARALDYALAPYKGASRDSASERLPAVDVVSLSMGGVASAAWAEAVNAAYDAGVCIVAAAGNNFSAFGTGVPTRFIVYPARFRRVIAACGVMADRRPYDGLSTGTMQGCWGPASKMKTALAAFTPNMPWAERDAHEIVDMNGAGTSSATPQIAGAAALYIAHHRAALAQLPHGWQRVEAVRQALFSSADKSADGGSTARLGNGILRAAAALAIAPSSTLTETPADSASLSLIKALTGLGAAPMSASRLESMLALEAAQLAQIPPTDGAPNPIEEAVDDPDVSPTEVPHPKLERFLTALREHPMASPALARRMGQALDAVSGAGRRTTSGPAPAINQPPSPHPIPAAPPFPCPPVRRLTGYAFDPSVAQRLGTREIGTMTFRLPWEPLHPGPIGEYLEVIDHDPTSNCFYAPVNLDDPHLLARDGLAPSERTPQFHQQMVYAVAQNTIVHFEKALGRKVLWAPGPPPAGASEENDSYYVPRLRIYPHALRDANAYYSPQRKALLFGYFRASPEDPGEHMSGAMVFTCLSHDVVAHETAHALLDGMHRRFINASNPDVLAFHEGFADIVALLLHFCHPEIVRDQMARTRGRIRMEDNFLGALASEFGRTTGNRGALRNYIGSRDPATGQWRPHVPRTDEYSTVEEPHARGGILVAAVFDAFLSIYEKRTADLIRIATGGSGVLPPGDLSHELINRLADEAAKAAEHVLRMCIRALDYCPPCDITFGEYLRAVISADVDLVPDDDLGYRTAFVDAFRVRAIYPRGVSSLSEESLLWRSPEADQFTPSQPLLAVLAALRDKARFHLDEPRREALFFQSRALRRELHDELTAVLRMPTGEADAICMGLDPTTASGKLRFEVHAARFASRVGPDGQLITQCIVELLQDKPLDDAQPDGEQFQGGSTLVVQLGPGNRGACVRYVIRKELASETRRERQREFHSLRFQNSLRGAYFGASTVGMRAAEPFAFVHCS
jgi:hypothetical protein